MDFCLKQEEETEIWRQQFEDTLRGKDGKMHHWCLALIVQTNPVSTAASRPRGIISQIMKTDIFHSIFTRFLASINELKTLSKGSFENRIKNYF